MGVPDFDGGWNKQPSQWRPSSVRQAAFALSLAHVINELKREKVCPLAVREIWAYWDQNSGSPKTLKLAVAWGVRPEGAVRKGSKPPPPTPEALIYAERESREFWAVSAQERDEGMLSWPFPNFEVMLAPKFRRYALLYRDNRSTQLAALSAREARLWRARRATLRGAGGEVADLFRQLGSAISYAALPMPSQRLTLSELRLSREEGAALAVESLLHCSAHGKAHADVELEYDFACREAGERSAERGNAVLSMAFLQGFFMALGDSPDWWRVAGGGEQEAFFNLLCRLEPTWGESLDAMARSRDD